MVRKINRGGLLVAVVFAMALSCGQAFAAGGRGDTRCVQDLASSASGALDTPSVDQSLIARTCRDTAIAERGVNAVRARFYSGRAYARAGLLDDAIAQLEIAMNASRDYAQLGPELRAAKLELAQAYRMSGRTEPAEKILNTFLSDSDPSVAYQKAMLALAKNGPAGQETAFRTLRIFAADNTSLAVAMGPAVQPAKGARPAAPVTISPGVMAEIQRGRSWLYRLGQTLGQSRLDQGDPRGAIDYFGPVAMVVDSACPDSGPIQCASSVTGTEGVGALPPAPQPTADQMLKSFYDLGIASLRAAGLRDTLGLGGFNTEMGGIGGLDCIGGQTGSDAASYFDVAERAFKTYIRRSSVSAASSETAHWGLACTILASQRGLGDPGRINQAIIELQGAPKDAALTHVTMARAFVLQGEVPSALASYTTALTKLNANPDRCDNPVFSKQAPDGKPQSRIFLEVARMQYAEKRFRSASPALADNTANSTFEPVIEDINAADPAQLIKAERYLKCAVAYDANNVIARLSLANLYLKLGSAGARSIDPPPFRKAEALLNYFTKPGQRNVDGLAEANYLLSRRMTLARQFQLNEARSDSSKKALASSGISSADAVRYAQRAYSLSQRQMYRLQGCLSQILFGVIGEQSLCAAVGDQDDELATAYFYEGLYWLRRGQKEGPGTHRADSWLSAIRAFNLGAEKKSSKPADVINPVQQSQPLLSELLLYGQRYTLYCAFKREPPENAGTTSPDVLSYFLLAGIPGQCGGPAS